MSDGGSQIFGIHSKYAVLGIVGICIVAGVAVALMISGGGDDTEWSSLAEDAIESDGYRVSRIVTCSGSQVGDSALVYGTFYTTNNTLMNYNISFVNDSGRWIVSNCYVY